MRFRISGKFAKKLLSPENENSKLKNNWIIKIDKIKRDG
jgi:hypothetical protein